MELKVFINRNASLERCPNCKSFATLKKSRSRNLYEKFIKLFLLRTYKCKDCGWRGSKSRYKLSKNAFKTLMIYLIIIALSIYIVNRVLSNLI